MPSSFSSPDQASLHLEIETAKIFDLFDDFYMHTHDALSEQRNLDALGEDEQNCLVRAGMRTAELDESLEEGIEETRLTLRSWMAAFETCPRTEKNRISHISTQIFFFCVWIWVATWRDASASNSVAIIFPSPRPNASGWTCPSTSHRSPRSRTTP